MIFSEAFSPLNNVSLLWLRDVDMVDEPRLAEMKDDVIIFFLFVWSSCDIPFLFYVGTF